MREKEPSVPVFGKLGFVDIGNPIFKRHVKLVRRHTCIESDHCDYTFYSSRDPCLKDHPEYVDELGFIRNR